jgi:3-phenylpropionate/cinnamic acid dioxygenase small subunit
MTVEELTDRLAVTDVMYRFAAGLDGRDWELYRSVFTDEFDLDYSSYRAENKGRWRADDWVARAASLFPGLDASQHAITNVRVSLAGDTAQVLADVRADHVLVVDGVAEVYTVCGRYDDGLVRTADGWRICRKSLHLRWSEGDAGLMQVARDRAAAMVEDA